MAHPCNSVKCAGIRQQRDDLLTELRKTTRELKHWYEWANRILHGYKDSEGARHTSEVLSQADTAITKATTP